MEESDEPVRSEDDSRLENSYSGNDLDLSEAAKSSDGAAAIVEDCEENEAMTDGDILAMFDLDEEDVDDRVKIRLTSFVRRAMISYRGPLPQSAELAGYEQVCPGAADRIIVMAENQARHRQEMERRVLEEGSKADADN